MEDAPTPHVLPPPSPRGLPISYGPPQEEVPPWRAMRVDRKKARQKTAMELEFEARLSECRAMHVAGAESIAYNKLLNGEEPVFCMDNQVELTHRETKAMLSRVLKHCLKRGAIVKDDVEQGRRAFRTGKFIRDPTNPHEMMLRKIRTEKTTENPYVRAKGQEVRFWHEKR